MLQLCDLCRLCAQKKRNKLNLFTSRDDEEASNLRAKISLCLSVQVTQEDLLPKMVCIDCQKSVEQFNAFRIKCQKAEERLNKMLSLALPNRLTVTRIKQECLESDFHENSNIIEDSSKCNETSTFINFKSVKNVKSEVEELNNENSWDKNNSSNLIQILSEEIVNQQSLLDVKQPQIEIISENVNLDFKNIDLNEKSDCDIKVIPENLFATEECFTNSEAVFPQIQNVATVIKATDSDQECDLVNSSSISSYKKVHIISDESEISSDEIDEKYLTLKEGEICDIDIEEMDALIKKKQNPNAVFKCEKCNKCFKFYKWLKKHKRWHDVQPQVFICDFCKNNGLKSFEFCNLKSLNNHISRKHVLSNCKHQCQFCSKVFQSQGLLNVHFKKVHDDSGAACQTCGKVFKNQARLNCHLKVHQEERPYICDQCGQTFKWSNALKIHIQWHKQEKTFLCSECGKKFTAKKNLIEHLNIHSGKRPYVCKECKATFAQVSAYSKHLYIHNKEKGLHKCDKCGKDYRHAFLLKQHLMRHSDVRPYECLTCHRFFKSQSDLSRHVKIHQEKQYACRVCEKKFALLKTLKDHMVRHTGIKHKCPVPNCGKTYTQRFPLTKHFCKHHPSLMIVKKKGGTKTHLFDKGLEKESKDFIQYEFVEKGKEKSFGDSLDDFGSLISDTVSYLKLPASDSKSLGQSDKASAYTSVKVSSLVRSVLGDIFFTLRTKLYLSSISATQLEVWK